MQFWPGASFFLASALGACFGKGCGLTLAAQNEFCARRKCAAPFAASIELDSAREQKNWGFTSRTIADERLRLDFLTHTFALFETAASFVLFAFLPLGYLHLPDHWVDDAGRAHFCSCRGYGRSCRCHRWACRWACCWTCQWACQWCWCCRWGSLDRFHRCFLNCLFLLNSLKLNISQFGLKLTLFFLSFFFGRLVGLLVIDSIQSLKKFCSSSSLQKKGSTTHMLLF